VVAGYPFQDRLQLWMLQSSVQGCIYSVFWKVYAVTAQHGLFEMLHKARARRLVYCLNRYPVLNIHQTRTRQAARKTQTMVKLRPTLTSETSKKLQRKPLIK